MNQSMLNSRVVRKWSNNNKPLFQVGRNKVGPRHQLQMEGHVAPISRGETTPFTNLFSAIYKGYQRKFGWETSELRSFKNA